MAETMVQMAARERFRAGDEKGTLLVGYDATGAKTVEFWPLGTVPADVVYRYRVLHLVTNCSPTRDEIVRQLGIDRRGLARKTVKQAQIEAERLRGMGA